METAATLYYFRSYTLDFPSVRPPFIPYVIPDHQTAVDKIVPFTRQYLGKV